MQTSSATGTRICAALTTIKAGRTSNCYVQYIYIIIIGVLVYVCVGLSGLLVVCWCVGRKNRFSTAHEVKIQHVWLTSNVAYRFNNNKKYRMKYCEIHNI